MLVTTVKELLGNHGEGTSREVLPVPLAADLRLPGLRDVVRHAEREIPVVLDGDKLHGNVGPAHAHLQQATPTSVAAVDCEAAAGASQALDQALGGVGWRAQALDLEWTVWDVLVSEFEVHSVDPWSRSSVLHLEIKLQVLATGL